MTTLTRLIVSILIVLTLMLAVWFVLVALTTAGPMMMLIPWSNFGY